MLVEHVAEKHGENLYIVKNSYETIREYLAWKENVEKETTYIIAVAHLRHEIFM